MFNFFQANVATRHDILINFFLAYVAKIVATSSSRPNDAARAEATTGVDSATANDLLGRVVALILAGCQLDDVDFVCALRTFIYQVFGVRPQRSTFRAVYAECPLPVAPS